jgi:nitrous oxide reductase accessory protein NosL
VNTATKIGVAIGAAIVLAQCSHAKSPAPASPAPATQSGTGKSCLTAIVDPDGRGKQVADEVNRQNGC